MVGVTSRGGGSGKTVTLEEFGNDLTKARKLQKQPKTAKNHPKAHLKAMKNKRKAMKNHPKAS